MNSLHPANRPTSDHFPRKAVWVPLGWGAVQGSGGDGQHQHGEALTLTALACCTGESEEHWDEGGLESQPKNVKRKREADKELEIRSRVKYLPLKSAGKGQDRRQSREILEVQVLRRWEGRVVHGEPIHRPQQG